MQHTAAPLREPLADADRLGRQPARRAGARDRRRRPERTVPKNRPDSAPQKGLHVHVRADGRTPGRGSGPLGEGPARPNTAPPRHARPSQGRRRHDRGPAARRRSGRGRPRREGPDRPAARPQPSRRHRAQGTGEGRNQREGIKGRFQAGATRTRQLSVRDEGARA